jgi:hypothetical protein
MRLAAIGYPLNDRAGAILLPIGSPLCHDEHSFSHFSMSFDRLRTDSFPYAVLVTIAALLAFCPEMLAQEAVGTTSISASNTQPVIEAGSENSASSLNPTPDSNLHTVTDVRNEVSAEPRRFQYGLQIITRGVYDDNINISQAGHVADWYFTIEPTLTLGFGDISGHEDNYLRLDYFPAMFFFLNHSENDAFQQVISLSGQHRFGRLTLSLGEQIAILDGTDIRGLADQTSPGSQPNLDVAGRTQFQTYSTKVDASYDLSGKTFLSSGANSLITDYKSSSLLSSGDVSGNLFINYRYSDKVTVGVGGTGGYNFAQNPNPGQTFEQANLRLGYQATGKVSLNFTGGIEFRQFEASSRGTYISPVFDLTASYQPFDGTNFSLAGSRRTYNSAVLGGQDFAETTITASMHQRFLQRFSVGISGGYENSDYFSTVNGVSATRIDDYYFFEPSIDFSITRFWTFGGYYLHRQSDSSLTGFSFQDNQVGLKTALVF